MVTKHEGKIPHGRPRHRWNDNSRMDLTDVISEGVDWIHAAQDRDQWRALMKTVMNFQVP